MSNNDEFLSFSWFKSSFPDTFCFSLQRKEKLKVHRLFRPISRPENKKSSFRTADQPSESLKMPVFPVFLPEMRKETPFAVVDKRRFFYGGA